MISESTIESILTALPRLRVAVIGDLFLDRYLDLDATLTEPSIETGLDAYQVSRVRSYPGAAGTVINNLASLGVGTILPIAVIGDDNNEFIYVGASREFVAARDGALFLGVNEGNLNDNSGAFDVTVEIVPN